MITINHPWVFIIGLLGNIISFMVFLAPLPTFIRIYKKKSTEGFQSVPYVVALFSAMLWIYYALLKGNSLPLITINVAGVIIETTYVAIYITYASRQARVSTLKLVLLMNFGGFSLIVLLCHYLIKAQVRLHVYGWICVSFSISVFAAPLSVMLPNVLGFLFGIAQMVLYGIYRKYDKAAEEQNLPEVVSPGQQQEIVEIDVISSVPNKTEDIISPHEQPQENDKDIHNHENEDITNHKDYLYEPPEGPSTCNVDAERIHGWPVGPAQVQLIECAV